MQTIDINAGTSIHGAARALCAQAPARATFNEIPIRARYATTRPEDVVKQYRWNCEIRAIMWQRSPAGLASAKDTADRLAAAQRTAAACVERLPALDMADLGAVLSWVEEMAPAADHIGVTYDHAAIVDTFAAAGWHAGMNCGEDFDINSADNFARWIAGQWLASKWPGVAQFIADWRAKFTPEAAPAPSPAP